MGRDVSAALHRARGRTCGWAWTGSTSRRACTGSRFARQGNWHAEPAKVADNLYFLGTKIHSAWALAGSEGIIVVEALFDYAAKDEILDGLKKVGLDPGKVKYVILSHAHGDHDGGAKLLQTRFRACI